MNKITIGLMTAAILAGVSGVANAAPGNHHNNKPQTVQVVHVQQRHQPRPARTVQRPRPVQIIHVNNQWNKPHGYQNHYSYGYDNCKNCHGTTADKVLGAVVIGAVAGGVLYALAN